MGSMDHTYGRMSWSHGLWTLLLPLLLQPTLRTNSAVCLLLAMSNILGEEYFIEENFAWLLLYSHFHQPTVRLFCSNCPWGRLFIVTAIKKEKINKVMLSFCISKWMFEPVAKAVWEKGILEFQSRTQKDSKQKVYFQKSRQKTYDQLESVFMNTHIRLKSLKMEKGWSDEWSYEWSALCPLPLGSSL